MQQGSNLRLLTEADYESAALTTQPCMPCTEGKLFLRKKPCFFFAVIFVSHLPCPFLSTPSRAVPCPFGARARAQIVTARAQQMWTTRAVKKGVAAHTHTCLVVLKTNK